MAITSDKTFTISGGDKEINTCSSSERGLRKSVIHHTFSFDRIGIYIYTVYSIYLV